MIFQVWVNFLYAALSGGTVLTSVMSQQYNCLMELKICVHVHKFYTIFTFHENVSSHYILGYVRAKMIVHAFMIEIDQLDY